MNMDYDEVETPEPERATLRDQFAMAALTGLLMRGEIGCEYVSERAYKFADMMLVKREVKP